MSESTPSRRDDVAAVPVGGTPNAGPDVGNDRSAGRFDDRLDDRGRVADARVEPVEPIDRVNRPIVQHDERVETETLDRPAPAAATRPVEVDQHPAPRAEQPAPTPLGRTGPTDREILARQKAKFGGMRFFLAFFGWLTATGLVVLLSALITGVLAATGIQKSAATAGGGAIQTASIVGIVALGVVLFIGYYAGGYVAGRMARFSGLLQGLAVWLWAVLIALVIAAIGAIAGSTTGAFSQLSATGLPISGATATSAGIATAVVAVVLSLVGALLGGLAGMRFHRKVDRFAGRD